MLAEVDAEQFPDQGGVPDLRGVAAQGGGHLGVEDATGQTAGRAEQHLQILARRVQGQLAAVETVP